MSPYVLSFCSIGHADMMSLTVSTNCLLSLHLLSFLFVIFLSQDIWFVMSDLVLISFGSQCYYYC